MVTLGILYLAVYLTSVLGLLILVLTQIPSKLVQNLSFLNLMQFIVRYKTTKNLFLFNFFVLSGLPPVGLFFIKFNFFFFILYQNSIIFLVIIFLFFLLNMLFYAQVFNFRNSKNPIYAQLTAKNVFSSKYHYNMDDNFSTYNTYYSVLFVIHILIFVFLMIVFFTDYFLIMSVV